MALNNQVKAIANKAFLLLVQKDKKGARKQVYKIDTSKEYFLNGTSTEGYGLKIWPEEAPMEGTPEYLKNTPNLFISTTDLLYVLRGDKIEIQPGTIQLIK